MPWKPGVLTRRELLRAASATMAVRPCGAAEFTTTTYTYKTANGCAIRADVHRQPGRQVVPALMWIHGGALIMGSRAWMDPGQLRRYTGAGFAVVAVDYRLAPETKLPDILTDIKDAYGWIREKGPALFHVDPERIAVVGHSAGGYLALATGYLCHPRPRAIVAFYGYGDISGAWYSRPDPYYLKQPAIPEQAAWAQVGKAAISETAGDRDNFYVYTRQHGLWPKLVAGLDPDRNSKAFDPYCPLRNVTKEYPPTLLLHGDQDTDVPYEQSKLMLQELKQHGVEADLITIAGGGHGFDHKAGDAQAATAFDRVLRFLESHAR